MKLRHYLTGWGLVALLALSTAQAQFTIDTVVTENAGLFSYSYTFNNFTADDVTSVALAGFATVPDAVQSLTVPEGFVGIFDSDAGVLFLLEGSLFFAANTSVIGFGFDSFYPSGAGGYDATTSEGLSLSGAATVAAIPEPSSAALIGGALIGFVVLGRRRARA
jgi:hypothetical protein